MLVLIFCGLKNVSHKIAAQVENRDIMSSPAEKNDQNVGDICELSSLFAKDIIRNGAKPTIMLNSTSSAASNFG